MGSDLEGQLKDRVQRKLEHLDTIASPQEAQAQVAILPLAAVHEGRYAIQQLKETYQGSHSELIDVIQPIIELIGWVSAATYFGDANNQREALVRSMVESGQFAMSQRGTDD